MRLGPQQRQASRLIAALLVVLGAGRGLAAPSLDAVVARTVRDNYGALHGCYRKVLAEDRERGGTLFVRVTLGPGDAVKSARAERDELKHDGAVRCILGWVRGWTLRGAATAGVAPGGEITIPLTFKPVPDQFVVQALDAREIPLSGGVARVMLHRGSIGEAPASMVRLEVQQKMDLSATGGDQALVVLSGRGRVTVGRGRGRPLRKGAVAWIPPQAAARVTGQLELLQLFIPAGPEQRLRGGSDGAVSGSGAKTMVVVRGSALDRRAMGHGRFSLRTVYLARGAKVQPERSVAMLGYVVSGTGTARRGSKTVELRKGAGLYFPAGTGCQVRAHRSARLVLLSVPVSLTPSREAGRREK